MRVIISLNFLRWNWIKNHHDRPFFRILYYWKFHLSSSLLIFESGLEDLLIKSAMEIMSISFITVVNLRKSQTIDVLDIISFSESFDFVSSKIWYLSTRSFSSCIISTDFWRKEFWNSYHLLEFLIFYISECWFHEFFSFCCFILLLHTYPTTIKFVSI